MGSCFSKKGSSSVASGGSSAAKPPPDSNPPCKIDAAKADREPDGWASPARSHRQQKEAGQEGFVKKEVFIIKHRKSHDRRASPEEKPAPDGAAPVVDCGKSGEDAGEAAVGPLAASGNGGESLPVNGASVVGVTAGVRTSNCTKEEVDAILIQCGRLSRSSSGRTGAASGGRVYSGSKRSYDFDNQNDDGPVARAADAAGSEQPEMNEDELVEKRQHRQRHRQSTPSRSHSQGSGARRRTPSRERDQRSSSRERRVSRSPARRSDNASLSNSNASSVAGAAGGSGNNNRPGKMVSVPASLVDKSNGGGDPPESQATVKRISVKRNAGEPHAASRGAASPRSQSPARQMSGGVGRQQNGENQQPSLSRNSSRKAEHSPYRRNPLGEIDTNARQQQPQPPSNKSAHKATEDGTVKEGEARMAKQTVDGNNGRFTHGTCDKTGGKVTEDNKARGCDSAEKEQQAVMEVLKRQAPMSGFETQKPQALARSRSSRLSELELNPQIVAEPTSYTTLLLEDIQNFHQKQNTTTPTVPACVTKACSIYEAVADLNSNKSSNVASALSELRKAASNQCSHNGHSSSYSGNDLVRKSEGRDPFVESELVVDDDLMEPTIHKYVTMKRGGMLKGDDKEEIESSGSNSFAGSGTQQWGGVSSSWEPGSADSSDCWTSNSKAATDDFSPLAFQRMAVSESGRQVSESRRDLNVKRRDFGVRQNGIGRSRT